ncbi:MAG TPA: arylsulfatase [Stellaceae bacterium]|jgi:arylsulfatase A-like enzyme|nr:arylsulfatase [Stellaceae bacterium]
MRSEPRPAAQQSTPTDGKPNIIFILSDNLGWGELGAYGGGAALGAPTPNIDKLAQEGLRLTNYNVEAQCTPSRSALMTGRLAIRSGTHSVPLGGAPEGLTAWEVTIAKSLSAAGYATAMYGKWHLGSIEGRFPSDQGFDEWYGIPRTTDEAMWLGAKGYDESIVEPQYIMEGKKGEKSSNVQKYDLEQRRIMDAALNSRSLDFIQRSAKAGKPFFVYLAITQPHYPALPHPDFAGKTGRGDYADVKVEMDHRVGEILDELDRLGIAKDTIVVFSSDNGPEPQQDLGGTSPILNGGSAGPWRGAMFTALEGSLRVPFVIRWPGHIPAGAVSEEMIHTVDMFPTFAALAGGSVPRDRAIDGVDQSDFFLGKTDKSNREGFPVYVGDTLIAVKWRNWKIHFYVLDQPTDPPLKLLVPRVHDLDIDPREERDVSIPNTWVLHPAVKIVGAFQVSLQKYPLITMGTPDPYVPPQ